MKNVIIIYAASCVFLPVVLLHIDPLGCNQELESSSGTCDPLCSLDETSSSDFEANYQPKTDLLKALAVFAAAITGAVAINHSWVAANQVYLRLVWVLFSRFIWLSCL